MPCIFAEIINNDANSHEMQSSREQPYVIGRKKDSHKERKKKESIASDRVERKYKYWEMEVRSLTSRVK